MSEEIKYDNRKIQKLIKTLIQEGIPQVKVGIIGQSLRKDGQTNAQIGAKHELGLEEKKKIAKAGAEREFGSSQAVQRSFLRQPITDNLGKYIKKSRAFNPEMLKLIVNQSSFVLIPRTLGVVAETIVQDAFDSGGFGKWKPSNMEYKTNHQTLVETKQLRQSISSEIEKGKK